MTVTTTDSTAGLAADAPQRAYRPAALAPPPRKRLGRLDVLPVDDLGVRAAIRDLYALDDLPDKKMCLEIAAPWRLSAGAENQPSMSA